MNQAPQRSYWMWWVFVAVVCVIAGTGFYLTRGVLPATADDGRQSERPGAVRVEVTVPMKREMDRTLTQPGSVRAFESVQLYAGVSGYLKALSVDIGDRVTHDQVLAEVAVPDLLKQVQRLRAAVAQADARVAQMVAGIASAKADLEAARVSVPQAEAMDKSKAAELRFREKQLERMRKLLALNSVDERLVDEKLEQRDAAREAEIAAHEGVNSATEKVNAMVAKVQKAEADAVEARAEVQVAQAELEKGEVLVKFATIVSPFDGVVTERNVFRADFVRAASEGTHLPLLTVQRTDQFRVVVQVPDRDVPYAKPNAPAIVEIDALPGEKFPAKISRVSQSEDPQTRLMHVEIDLLNPSGKICDGMYGRVTILLEKSDMLSVPSASLVGKSPDGKGNVYVVRDKHAHLVPVRIGADNGLRVGIASGLKEDDQVILHPAGIEDGVAVAVSEAHLDKGH